VGISRTTDNGVQRFSPSSRAQHSLIRCPRDFRPDTGRLENRALLSSVPGRSGVITYNQGGTQRIYSFDRSANGHLYVNYWDGSAWHWADQGTPAATTTVAGDPGVITYLQGNVQRIYAFANGTDGRLYVDYWDSHWHWADQGAPAAVSFDLAIGPGLVPDFVSDPLEDAYPRSRHRRPLAR
jgi:hypothetical protein